MFVADTHPEKMNLGVVCVWRASDAEPSSGGLTPAVDDASARDTDDAIIRIYDTGGVP